MSSDVPKKVLWIFVFLILAAIAILGVLFIRGYQTGKQVTSIEETPQPQATDTSHALQLSLIEPSQDIATSSAKVTLQGKTTPQAMVTITGAAEDNIIIASQDGSFSVPISLLEGLNMVTVEALHDEGDAVSTKRSIVYTKGTL